MGLNEFGETQEINGLLFAALGEVMCGLWFVVCGL